MVKGSELNKKREYDISTQILSNQQGDMTDTFVIQLKIVLK